MKKILIAILSTITVLTLFLSSCNFGDNPNDGTTTAGGGDKSNPPPAEEVSLVTDGKSNYQIVRPDSSSKNGFDTQAAIALNNAFKSACGSYLKIVNDWSDDDATDYELCIGDLTRNGKYYDADVSSLNDDQFSVKVYGKRVVFLSPTAYGVAQAVEWFIGQYLQVGSDEETIASLALPADFEYVGSFNVRTGIRIMTQNLLATDTEYEGYVSKGLEISVKLEDHTLAKRQPRVLSLIKTYMPDSLGVQECSASWRTYFDANLSSIGYKRIGASKNQKIGIVYNTDKLTVVDSGSFWLTESPETLRISEAWGTSSDGLTERLAMYVVFEVKATGERYVHFNTHLDTKKNSIIQTKQTEVILEYINKVLTKYGNIPVFLTGDFNYTSDSPSYTVLTDGLLSDTKSIAMESSGSGSFNKFKGQDYASKPIDQIMTVKDTVTVTQYRVVYDRFDGCFASDHYAVYIDVMFKQ